MINERYLVVISGPSGCGKDTVVRHLLSMRENTELSVSCTTRPMREHERPGVDYYYISHEEFRERIRGGRMMEYVEYSGNLYGTPLDETEHRLADEKTVLLVIEVQGGHTIKTRFPHALLIFITPPSFEELERRLHTRNTESDEEIERRLAIARFEMRQVDFYDAVVVNDSVERCAAEISEIIDEWQQQEDDEDVKTADCTID